MSTISRSVFIDFHAHAWVTSSIIWFTFIVTQVIRHRFLLAYPPDRLSSLGLA